MQWFKYPTIFGDTSNGWNFMRVKNDVEETKTFAGETCCNYDKAHPVNQYFGILGSFYESFGIPHGCII